MPTPTRCEVVPRPATVDDADDIGRLVERMGGHDEAGRAPRLAELFGSIVDAAHIRAIVAESRDAGVVGYAELHARPSLLGARREAWLAVLAVAPERRGTGVGSALLAAVDLAAAQLGCDAVVLESSTWREHALAFYESQGFTDAASPARRLHRPVAVPGAAVPGEDDLVSRFLAAAARAAAAVGGAIAGLDGAGHVGLGADGAPTHVADRAAEIAVVEALAPLGIAVVSEEGGNLVREWSASEPWICLDPLDGSRNQCEGHPPWATAVALVVGGRPVAGLVCDHTSGRRWWAAEDRGAWVDGRPARPRPGGLVAVPSIRPGGSVPRVGGDHERIRMSGSTTIDLCRVADGSLGAFVDRERGVVHPHDLAAPLIVLREAGAAVRLLDGGPIVLEPDPARVYRLAAAADEESLDSTLRADPGVHVTRR